MEKLAVIVRIAFRNLFASRLKTFIVGGIIFFGAVLVVVGSSLLDSVDAGMTRSIVGSASGDIQVYSAKSKDDLSIWGQMGSDSDLAPIDSFAKLKAAVQTVPNVKSVVPMGISGAMVTSGNTIDLTLGDLRTTVRKLKAGDTSPALATDYAAQKAHVRHIVEVLQTDQKNAKAIVNDKPDETEDAESLAKAAAPAFWTGFDADPYAALEFLENRVAPQATDADIIYLRYVGTDMDAFQKSFDRMEIVDGTAVPEGKRGFLFAKYFYEDSLKLKTARRLDKIKERLAERGMTIAKDAELQRLVKENREQTNEIMLQLDDVKARDLTAKLQKELGSKETDVQKLLAGFLDTNDANFPARYAYFYGQIAPMLELYRIRAGDTLTINAFTKSGYRKSVNIKVYGTFQFKGLEKSPLAGSLNLMDLASFRSLYGFMTADSAKEIADIKSQVGAKDIPRAQAEADLFGSGRDITADATPGVIDAAKELGAVGRELHARELTDRVYSKAETENGAVLNAAIFLKDPSKLDQSITEIEAAGKSAGLELKAVSWQKASGIIGQFVLMMRLVLYIFVLIIFSVALVIINNALVMATLERVREIGTLRAMGAQKRFILAMLFVEAVVVGLVFGGLGAATGAGIIKLIALKGIPATSDVMVFFFSAPRLIPHLGSLDLIGAFVIVLVVSALSSFYPAWLAMRISPLQAMQSED